MGKREKELICPYCGGKDFLGTSQGTMCKACNKIVNAFSPVVDEAADEDTESGK